MKFEIPIPHLICNSTEELDTFLNFTKEYREYINALYFPLGKFGENRCSFGVRSTMDMHLDRLEERLKAVAKHSSIPCHVLLNDIYNRDAHDDVPAVAAKIRHYASMFELHSVIIADIALIDRLASLAPELQFSLSVNAYRTIPELLNIFALGKDLPISRIILGRDFNRCPETIQHLMDHQLLRDKQMVIMVNEGCIPHCPFRESGDVEISECNSFDNHIAGCKRIIRQAPWLFLASPFLTRDMLKRSPYARCTLKIAGRNHRTGFLKNTLDYYINGKSTRLAGILSTMRLVEIRANDLDRCERFTQAVLSCDKACWTCRICKTVYKDLKIERKQWYHL